MLARESAKGYLFVMGNCTRNATRISQQRPSLPCHNLTISACSVITSNYCIFASQLIVSQKVTRTYSTSTTIVSGIHYNTLRYYDPKLGRYINRDPIGEMGGGNIFAFVDNDPMNWTDSYGLWKSWTHRHLTEQAWNALKKPGEMPSGVQAMILGKLKEANVATDKGAFYKNLAYHFNRPPNGAVAKAKESYLQVLKDEQSEITKDFKSRSKENCKNALERMGRLSHAWQDYYAHAVHKDYNDSWRDRKIGEIKGDPEHPGTDMIPSSWGGVLNDEEHNWLEPGKEAPDVKARESGARTFTQNGYQTFLNEWWSACECFYK